MPYIIKCWIPVEADEPEIYDSVYDGHTDLVDVKNMQPENKYQIVECDKQGNEI